MSHENTALKTLSLTLSFPMMVHIQDAALALYENGSFDEDQEDDPEYVIAEISQAAENALSDDLTAEWEFLTEHGDAIEQFIAKGEASDWGFDNVPEVILAADNYPFVSADAGASQVKSVVSAVVKHDDQYRGISLSITHVHENTRHWLSNVSQHRKDVIDRDYGFLIMIHDNVFKGEVVPLDLQNILRQCDLAGYKQVILADDAEISVSLPVFD